MKRKKPVKKPPARQRKAPAENRGAEGGKRDDGMPVGQPFQRGKSGNPGGRPKELAEVRDMARKRTSLAFNTLIRICRKGKLEVARIMAAQELLNRGWGRNTQPVELSGKDGGPIKTQEVPVDLSGLSLEELRHLRDLAAKCGGAGRGDSSTQPR